MTKLIIRYPNLVLARFRAHQFSNKCEGGRGKVLCLIYSKLLCIGRCDYLKWLNHTDNNDALKQLIICGTIYTSTLNRIAGIYPRDKTFANWSSKANAYLPQNAVLVLVLLEPSLWKAINTVTKFRYTKLICKLFSFRAIQRQFN